MATLGRASHSLHDYLLGGATLGQLTFHFLLLFFLLFSICFIIFHFSFSLLLFIFHFSFYTFHYFTFHFLLFGTTDHKGGGGVRSDILGYILQEPIHSGQEILRPYQSYGLTP